MFLHSLFMQDQGTSRSRKPWYQRALEAASLWRSAAKSRGLPAKPTRGNLRKSSSLRAATSTFTRACLCAPISGTHSEALFGPPPPRRSSSSCSRPRTLPASAPPPERALPPRASAAEVRRVFRGKSLTDDVLMRRFVVEEASAAQCLRRRNQVEFMRRRIAARRRRRLGPSRLSRMTMADEDRVKMSSPLHAEGRACK